MFEYQWKSKIRFGRSVKFIFVYQFLPMDSENDLWFYLCLLNLHMLMYYIGLECHVEKSTWFGPCIIQHVCSITSVVCHTPVQYTRTWYEILLISERVISLHRNRCPILLYWIHRICQLTWHYDFWPWCIVMACNMRKPTLCIFVSSFQNWLSYQYVLYMNRTLIRSPTQTVYFWNCHMI